MAHEPRPSSPQEPQKRRARTLAVVAVLAVAIALASWAWMRAPGDLLSSALGPVAVMPGADDGAGDAPSVVADTYLPLSEIFEDERVLAALGPITRLSCTKDDPDAVEDDPARATDAQRMRALKAPLDPAAATDQLLSSAPLISAAATPIALFNTDSIPDDPPSHLAASGHECPALLQYSFNRLQTGETQSLCQFEGKVLLVVNTASYCAYTRQYEGLEAMYRKYKDRGLVVVGFPSNDFNQEPGNNKDIAEFCRTTYGVQFPMFEKSSVASIAANPLFKQLAAATGTAPQWNFHKYVVDRGGHPVASFSSTVTPTDRALTDLVERLLADRSAAARG
jgi:glutathione peroxidase